MLFSDSAASAKNFEKLEKAKGIEFSLRSVSELKKNLKTEADCLIYADAVDQDAAALKKQINMLSSMNRAFGIVDAKGSISDPAWLFHSGAADYIGKFIAKEGVDAARIKKVAAFAKRFLVDTSCEEAADRVNFSAPLSGCDWTSVKEGSSYMFSFLFFELDDQQTIKRNLSGTLLEKFQRKVQSFVEYSFADINGKVWMWNNLCGLVLFPFDGQHCPAIMKAFQLMLNRRIISFEDFNYDMFMSYRIAIHIGESAFMSRGNTGEIVSDSVNSIFHLGQKFAEPATLYLTADAIGFVPKGLEDMFVPAGAYEGREIYRMRYLV